MSVATDGHRALTAAARWQASALISACAAEAPAPLQEEGEEQDPAKKARALKKKLRQLEQLREKDPASLSAEQRAKLQGEPALRAELDALQLDGG